MNLKVYFCLKIDDLRFDLKKVDECSLQSSSNFLRIYISILPLSKINALFILILKAWQSFEEKNIEQNLCDGPINMLNHHNI